MIRTVRSSLIRLIIEAKKTTIQKCCYRRRAPIGSLRSCSHQLYACSQAGVAGHRPRQTPSRSSCHHLSMRAAVVVGTVAVGAWLCWRIGERRRTATSSGSLRPLPFTIVDVFTTGEAMTGNQLLVVEDRADSLSDSAMQCIAAEIGFAESAFVRSNDSVRIFTIDEEVPQAGHPIIGTAEVVGGPCAAPGRQLTLVTRKGPISVRSGAAGGTWFASQDPPVWLGHASRSSVGTVLRSGAERLVGESFAIGSTCGLPYALVPVATRAALDDLTIDAAAPPGALQAQCTELANGLALYFYVRTGASSCRTRMFCHEGGRWVEDVATGSAAGPLACLKNDIVF